MCTNGDSAFPCLTPGLTFDGLHCMWQLLMVALRCLTDKRSTYVSAARKGQAKTVARHAIRRVLQSRQQGKLCLTNRGLWRVETKATCIQDNVWFELYKSTGSRFAASSILQTAFDHDSATTTPHAYVSAHKDCDRPSKARHYTHCLQHVPRAPCQPPPSRHRQL